ncbi:cellulose biosynthesis protein BcsQ [Nocardiopsis mwathae]|uniref:Cellulose biosynthesis protein BcsQ n=1 Tax=Nocardiopsis mwathae TaxID=1472723 RepID=A0A7W9YKV3_9ACTN|nr:AAA family ATPase [Nocardiopsis mwathae]MBB6174024.1 cellulose biosynthesis protein BcsQ [Nocardiopsis mwathae]
MTSIALFNNKGGVGKTTLVYHLAHMYQRQGARVLAVDLDPQSNLTSMFLGEDDLAQLWHEEEPTFQYQQGLIPAIRAENDGTVAQAVKPIIEGTGDVELIRPVEITERLWLLPGDLELSRFEDDLSQSWGLTFKGDPRRCGLQPPFIESSSRPDVTSPLTLS